MKPTTAHPSLRFVALLILCLLPSVAAAQIPQFDSFYVFGDSLADNGNILIQTGAMGMQPPVPPSTTPHRTYFKGRFSNGYISFEYLWQRLTGHQPGSTLALKPFLAAPLQRANAIDFAFGGTGTPYVDKTPGGVSAPGLKGQIELFRLSLRGRRPSNRSLYAIATGANDYRLDAFNVPMNPADVVHNIEDAIVSLYEMGARDVIVLDLPDLGKIPANAIDPVTSADATAISAAHNAQLDSALARLQARYPRLHLIAVKLDPLFDDLQTSMESRLPLIDAFMPATPGVSACLFINPASCVDVPSILFNADFGFLFWDVVHPTTEAYRLLGDYMYNDLASEYE
ncbi:MAG: SGNH/GDSL hydrolase family protein [Vicinamibacterales bacterium]